MKFKRLMSASLAGIMAVSSGVVCQIGASAEETVTDRDLKTGSIGAVTLESDGNGGYNNPSFTLDNKWGNATPVKGYSSLEVTFTCAHPDAVSNIYLIAQSGTMPNGWYNTVSGAYAKGKITLDFSELQNETYEHLLIQVQPKNTYKAGDEFDPGITITSAKLKAIDTREWVETELSVTGIPTTKDNQNIEIELGADKTLDITKYSSEAQLVVYYTSGPDKGYGNVQVVDNSTGWDKIGDFYSMGDGVKTSGAIDLAFMDGMTKIVLQNNNGCTITKVAVKDVKSTEPALEPHKVTVTQPETGGTVEVDKTEAKKDEVVTVTTSPAHGYNLFEIVVKDADDGNVDVTKDAENKNVGKFTMPDKAVTVTATFEEDNALLVAAAKEAADKAIAAISATNSTDGDAILTKVTEAVDAAVSKIIADAKVTAKWKAAPTITKATEEAAGSIVGTIVLSKGEGDKQATAESKVELTIPKLAADDKTRVEQAVKLTEGVLEELKGKVTNETTETDILDKIKEAIVDTKAEATISNFKSEKATSEKAGKITGTVNLKSGNETGTVKIALDIAILEKTDAEKLADAKKAAQEVVDAAKTAEDITKEAIEKAVNNKDVDVKVEYKITKEATTEAEGEATVTVTLTLGKESETITETFVIAKLKHSAPSEEKVEKKDPTAIWEGSQALGNWDQQIDLAGEKIADLGAGVLIFELADCTEEAKLCVQLKDGSWPCLDGTEILTLKNGQTEARIAVTAEALAATKKCGAAVKGSGVTVKKISFIGTEDNFDKKVTVSANDDKAPSVSTVVTEIDDEGKMEQIAICAISEEAAKTCTSYKVTITRASDNKVFTVEKVTDCWKKAKYTNVNGEEVLVEAAEGDYCIVLDITGISGEWGALTIRITANNE